MPVIIELPEHIHFLTATFDDNITSFTKYLKTL
jgi:hypothetical protein